MPKRSQTQPSRSPSQRGQCEVFLAHRAEPLPLSHHTPRPTRHASVRSDLLLVRFILPSLPLPRVLPRLTDMLKGSDCHPPRCVLVAGAIDWASPLRASELIAI